MVSHGFWLVSMVFQGSFMVFGWFPSFFKVVRWLFMVFYDFWLVSMVFQVSFMVSHGFWLVSMVFKVVSWFLVCFHGFQGGFMAFHSFSRWFHSLS